MTGKLFVIDASVAIKVLIDEPLSDRAEGVFQRLAEDPEVRFLVPDLLFTECANVLWKYTQRYGMSSQEAARKLDQLRHLALEIIPTVDHLPAALKLAGRYGISVYDACYLAVSRFADAPFITADANLIRKVGNRGKEILFLGDL